MKMSNNESRYKSLNKSTSNNSTVINHPKKSQLIANVNSPSHYGYYRKNKDKHAIKLNINQGNEKKYEDTYYKAINTLSNCQNKMTKEIELISNNKANKQSKVEQPPIMTPFPKYGHHYVPNPNIYFHYTPNNTHQNTKVNFDIDNEHKDNRLEYILNALNMGFFIPSFIENQIEFDDLLLLSKDDLKEMSIPIGPRNRLLSFRENYCTYANSYTLEEIQSFFYQNKHLDHLSSSNICSTDSNAIRHQRCNSSCIDMKKLKDNIHYIPLKTDMSELVNVNQLKHSPILKKNESESVRNTHINLNYNFNRRVLSNTDINKEDQMEFYNPHENQNKNKNKIINSKPSLILPKNKNKNLINNKKVDTLALTNNIEKLVSKSSTKISPSSKPNRINQNKFKSKQNNININQKGKDEIRKLFEIEANLKSHLEKCNKSINQKELVSIVLLFY